MTASRFRKGLLCLAAAFALSAPAASAQVVINEILYRTDPSSSDPLRSQQWVELYNKGAASVDLTGWKISGNAGSGGPTARSLPAVNLAAGAYLVLHIAAGTTTNIVDYYTGDSAPVWSADADEAALYSPQGIVDFLAWYDAARPYFPGTAHADAVAAKIWTPFAAINSDRVQVHHGEKPRTLDLGVSMGRDSASTDTDATSDFEPHGGVDGQDISPGRKNLDIIDVIEVPAPAAGAARGAIPAARPAAAPTRKWTVMIYANGDNSLQNAIYRNILEIERGGGSDPNINFVVMYDGKAGLVGTRRGLITGGSGANPASLTLQPPASETTQMAEQNMGDPATLTTFVNWAKSSYPATRYALIMSSHGLGWKSFGPDETSLLNGNPDELYMGELLKALNGQFFDIIGFDACLMGQVEVAYQLRQFANFLVASEETIPGPGFPYDSFSLALKQNPDWTGIDLGRNIVSGYASRYVAKQDWTLSLIGLQAVSNLVTQIDTWSGLLKTGAGLIQQRDNPLDNGQVRLKFDRIAATQFDDPNFVDLGDFTKQVRDDGVLPDCIKTPIPTILNLISGTVVITQVHSPEFKNVTGMTIHFPRFRKRSPESPLGGDEDYDWPWSRATDGASHYAVYAPSHDQLPLSARDREDNSNLNPRTQWPEPPSPTLLFVSDTHWSNFLERFYHPTADNHIIKAISPYGEEYYPTTVGGTGCTNPVDSISAPINSVIEISGAGSSDADMADFTIPVGPGVPPAVIGPNPFPAFYFWDLDSTVACPKDPYLDPSKCNLEPQTVPAGTPADQAITNMDADQDITDTSIDQNDAQGPKVYRTCNTVGAFSVNLMVWDDNHQQLYHNTSPTAAYVHPQSDSNLSNISCGIVFEDFWTTIQNGPPSTLIVPVTFTVGGDPYSSASYVGLYSGNLTITFSGLGGAATGSSRGARPQATPTVTIKGDQPQLVPATGPFNTATNSFDITGTATSLIAGFSNVQARYTMSFGPGFNSVSGTYLVGLNSTLNNEPQPVTYKVTGTTSSRTFSPPAGPLITAVNSSGGGPVIAQNGWIEIHGINIVPSSTPAAGVIWSSAPSFAQGQLPTSLSGVSVTVNGKPAFVYFYCSSVTDKACSTDQVNVLTPLDNTTGPVTIVVTSGSTSTPPFTVTMHSSAPAFLQFAKGFVTATHSDYSLIGPTTLYPGYSTPARTSETVVLYGVGFGLPSTPLVNGSSTQSGTLSPQPVCTIAGIPAPVAFAGLVAPGLYQVNLTVPAGASTAPVVCTYNGNATAAGPLLAVQP